MRTAFLAAVASLVSSWTVVSPAAGLETTPEAWSVFAPRVHREATRIGCQAITIDRVALDELASHQFARIEAFPLSVGRVVDLDLETFSIMSPDCRREVMTERGVERLGGDAARHWRGTVAGVADSHVFLSDTAAGTFGWIRLGDERFILSTGDPKGDRTLVCYPTDGVAASLIEWTPWTCGADGLVHGPMPETSESPAVAASGTGGPCIVVELAVDTDQEFLALFNSTAEAQGYLETLIAGSSEIYQRDTGVRLTLVYSRLWETTDPWNEINTVNQMFQFGDYWDANMSGQNRDLAHLLSGRPLGGGVAFIAAACESYGYGVSANLTGSFPYPLQNHSSQNWDIVVVTHELGHNLGSRHTHNPAQYDPVIDDCYVQGGGVGACTDAYGGTIMSYCHLCPGGMSNLVLEFHPRVRQVIVDYVTNQPCLAADGTTDCPPTCAADLNGDRTVDAGDLGLVIAAWQTSDAVADIDGSGLVDGIDLAYILGYWGPCAAP